MEEKSLQDLFLEIGIAVERFMNDMQSQINALKNQKSEYKPNIELVEQELKEKDEKNDLTLVQELRRRLSKIYAPNVPNVSSALNTYYKMLNPNKDLDTDDVSKQMDIYKAAPTQWNDAVRLVNRTLHQQCLIGQKRAKLEAGIMIIANAKDYEKAKEIFSHEIIKKDGAERFFDYVNDILMLLRYQPKENSKKDIEAKPQPILGVGQPEKKIKPTDLLILKLREIGVKNCAVIAATLKMYEAIKKGENYKSYLMIKKEQVDFFISLYQSNQNLWEGSLKVSTKLYNKFKGSKATWGAYVAIMCGHGNYNFVSAEMTIKQLMAKNNGSRRVWDIVRGLMFTPNGEITQLKTNLF